MNDPVAVHFAQSGAELSDDPRHSREAEWGLIQSRSQSLALQEWHGQAGLAGGADPRIENADHARMLHRSQGGHLVREAVANPALLAGATVEHLHGKTGGAVAQIARFVDHRKSASGYDALQLITPGESCARIIVRSGKRARQTRKLATAITAPQQKDSLLDAEIGSVEPRHVSHEGNERAGGQQNADDPQPGEPRSAGPDTDRIGADRRRSGAREAELEGIRILGQARKLE